MPTAHTAIRSLLLKVIWHSTVPKMTLADIAPFFNFISKFFSNRLCLLSHLISSNILLHEKLAPLKLHSNYEDYIM